MLIITSFLAAFLLFIFICLTFFSLRESILIFLRIVPSQIRCKYVFQISRRTRTLRLFISLVLRPLPRQHLLPDALFTLYFIILFPWDNPALNSLLFGTKLLAILLSEDHPAPLFYHVYSLLVLWRLGGEVIVQIIIIS